jgi:hypothetical protein
MGMTMEIQAERSAIASSARPEETSPICTSRRRPWTTSTSTRCGRMEFVLVVAKKAGFDADANRGL